MPSSTFATVSHESTASSSAFKMSFQRITAIGSMPSANSDATARTDEPVGRVHEPVDLDQVLGGVSAVFERFDRERDLACREDEHRGDLQRRVGRRLDAVEAEPV